MKPNSLAHALFVSLLAIGSLEAFAADVPRVSFTTFNIRFYGTTAPLSDTSGAAADERDRRDANIRALLDRHGWSDVIAFQEIVDIDSLQRNVVGPRYSCHGYRHSSARHQHVVLCVRAGLRLDIADDDNNYTLEDVALTTLRPAVHGILRLADGTAFAQVVAVHLKAMPDMTATRLRQAGLMRAYFDRRTSALPLVVLGDFNTFGTDDVEIGTALGLHQIDTPFPYTFHDLEFGGSKFDRVYAGEGLRLADEPRLAGPCSDEPVDLAALRTYNDSVSDHCPLSLTLEQRTIP